MNYKHRVGFRAAAVLSLFFLSFSAALAGNIFSGDVSVSFVVEGRDVETGEMLASFQQDIGVGLDGSFAAEGLAQANGVFELGEFGISGNVDPVASLAYGLTNVAAVPIAFTTSLVVPVPPQGPVTLIGGSTGGSVTDANVTGGASVTNNGALPFFMGLIDAAPVLNLHTAPFSFSTPAGTGSITPITAGLPGPTLPGPPAAFSIAVENNFVLSAGDSMSATNVFQVIPIPEPGTWLLGVVGIVGLVSTSRRKQG